MTANYKPIFPIVPVIGWGRLLTANTAMDGTGTQVTLLTAGANGTRVDALSIKYEGTTVATVLRVFVNNGSTNATPANNILIAEMAIPANTSSNSLPQTNLTLPLDIALPAGYKLNVAIGTTVANNLALAATGGDY